jgi:hypothetical protein
LEQPLELYSELAFMVSGIGYGMKTLKMVMIAALKTLLT